MSATPNIDFLRGLLAEFDALEQPSTVLRRIEDGITGLGIRLARIEQGDSTMAGEIEKLQQDVQAQGTVVQSAITLIQGFGAALAAAGTDKAALAALSTDIETATAALAQAVAANTTAAPEQPIPTDDSPTPTPEPSPAPEPTPIPEAT